MGFGISREGLAGSQCWLWSVKEPTKLNSRARAVIDILKRNSSCRQRRSGKSRSSIRSENYRFRSRPKNTFPNSVSFKVRQPCRSSPHTSIEPGTCRCSLLQDSMREIGANETNTFRLPWRRDGTFELTNIPAGRYWLKVGATTEITNLVAPPLIAEAVVDINLMASDIEDLLVTLPRSLCLSDWALMITQSFRQPHFNNYAQCYFHRLWGEECY